MLLKLCSTHEVDIQTAWSISNSSALSGNISTNKTNDNRKSASLFSNINTICRGLRLSLISFALLTVEIARIHRIQHISLAIRNRMFLLYGIFYFASLAPPRPSRNILQSFSYIHLLYYSGVVPYHSLVFKRFIGALSHQIIAKRHVLYIFSNVFYVRAVALNEFNNFSIIQLCTSFGSLYDEKYTIWSVVHTLTSHITIRYTRQ